MDKFVERSGGSSNSQGTTTQLVASNSHPGEEYLASCDGWVRPSSQAKCKTLLRSLLQGCVAPENATTS